MASRPQRWDAVCSKCYSGFVARNVPKREAEVAAVSHMNLYRHDVSVIPTIPKDRGIDKQTKP